MPSMENLLNTIGQVAETFIKGLNNLFNADLHGLEILGLLMFPGAALTIFTTLAKHRR